MIGLVIVTHGRLAEEMRSATEHVVGPQENFEIVCIGPDDDMEKRRDNIRAAAAKTNKGDGVLILTDMFGGTPSNLAISLLDEGRIEVVAGVNLPMMIKVSEARTRSDLAATAQKAKEAGQRYIAIASEILAGET